MRLIMSAAHCINDYASEEDYPRSFVAVLNTELQQLIKKMQAKRLPGDICVDVEAYGTWSNIELFDVSDDQLVAAAEEQEFDIECQELKVSADGFWFTGVPKFLDADMTVQTEVFSFSLLD